VVFAYHDVGVRCLQVLLDAGIEDPAERVWFASVAELAGGRGLETLLDPAPVEVERRVREAAPDFIFSFYYRRMLPPALLALARRGAYNMHGSLLPRHRGRAPVNRRSAWRRKPAPHGPVGGAIGPDDLAIDVFRKVTGAAETVLRRSLPRLLAGTAELRPQDLAHGSYHGARRPEDGRIDWSKSAAEIHNLVRAVAPPFPGAFTDEGGRRRIILRTRIEPGRRAQPGRLGPYREGGAWFADCGDNRVLRLLQIDPPT
jgi:methionyl-tRNA formyltransferase